MKFDRSIIRDLNQTISQVSRRRRRRRRRYRQEQLKKQNKKQLYTNKNEQFHAMQTRCNTFNIGDLCIILAL
ncbi:MULTISPECIES: hypothetical protein [Edwardsiella]|uniref:Uncharacterized protein n=1 Tax=Edwardsiella anguillarum TaxID=1821960 RepID=A0ABY8SEB1_9GAMM|nr:MULTISPECIES: hypothetical protein [Edwardsiella]KAB0590916.1 hypothetical protein F7P84_10780 [Edwardsiella anguillarum]UBU94687.1 hypothetical protein AAZ33_19540 [Edwardsiella sp. LADL05-105]UOU78347.1 hypothetical protein MUN71_15070 [Edwardsiella anguillarum]WHP83118.1 hypothetical protein MQ095_15220 [Edwardsiella anguillarum]WHP86913.1 hypothetical protein MQ088_15215 [Edwardsiella anguillarum]